MRYHEFYQTLTEGGNSAVTTFCSEVGFLAAFCGITFDPAQPEASFANSRYILSPGTIEQIVANIHDYDEKKFKKWETKSGPAIVKKVLNELSKLGYPEPTELSWVGRDNQSSVADIKFINHPIIGVSIKESGAPTLANMTAKSIGLDKGPDGDPDIFRHYAKGEWGAVKAHAVRATLDIAKQQPGKSFAPIKDKYSITFMAGEMPQPDAKIKITKKVAAPNRPPVPAPQQQAPVEPPVPQEHVNDDQHFNEDANDNDGYFVIKFDGKSLPYSEETIMASLAKNATWQRVFGDYFQSRWNKDEQLTKLGKSLFAKIGADFVHKIKVGLADQNKINSAVKMGEYSYFYTTPSKTYYVPAVNNNTGLVLQNLDYTSPSGTSQNFLAEIGYQGEPPASVLIYIRYANGTFDQNPTVRVQSLKNPQGLGWIQI